MMNIGNSKFSKALPFKNITARVFFKKWRRIVLYIVVVGVLVPSFQESLAVEAEKSTELQYSGLVSGEGSQKDVIGSIDGAILGVSQVGQNLSKGGTEGGGSIGLPDFEVVSQNKMGADTSENKKRNEVFESQMFILLGFIFAVLIPLFSNYNQNSMRPPNVK